MFLPDDEGYVCAAGEATIIRALRRLCMERGVYEAPIRATNYWKRSADAARESIDD